MTHSLYLYYNTLLLLLSPFLLVYAVVRDLGRIGLQGLPARLGNPALPRQPSHPCIWIHAASVGETMAAAPIIRALRALRPGTEIVFSNITATGHQTALDTIPDVQHIYFPFDFPLAVRRALRLVQPDICVMVETELWPNFIHLAGQEGIPVCLVNGRISDRSFRRASLPLARSIFRWMLRGLCQLGMQTGADQERACSLGANLDKVQVMGSSKFEGAIVADPAAEQVAEEMQFPLHAPTLVAGSTHAGEDEAILDAFLQIRERIPDACLIIAPRRLERVPELRQALSRRGIAAIFRSDLRRTAASVPSPNPQSPITDPRSQISNPQSMVLVLDTIGELRRVYSLARVAFVGGSLVPVGGHDLLQPLAKGKPVLFGPHTHNCRELAAVTLEQGAGLQISGASDLARECVRLLEDEVSAQRMGETGLRLIQENQGASQRYARMILEVLERNS